jgi:hypothetical protein
MTAKFFIITAAVMACVTIISAGFAIEGFKKAGATRARLDEAVQAAAEAKDLLVACEKRIRDTEARCAKAREIEARTVREMEKKRNEFNQNFDAIRADAGSIDSGLLDDGVRQCAIDAYRAAVCADSGTDHSPLPGTSGAGTP